MVEVQQGKEQFLDLLLDMQLQLNCLVIIWVSSSYHPGLSYGIFRSTIAESDAVVVLVVSSADVELAYFDKFVPDDLIFPLGFLE